jgi:hypothetical protein
LESRKSEISDIFVHKIENIEISSVKLEVEVKDEVSSDDDRCTQEVYVEEEIEEKPKKVSRAKKKPKNKDTSSMSSKHQRGLSNNERLHLVPEYFRMQCDKCSLAFSSWKDVEPHFKRDTLGKICHFGV